MTDSPEPDGISVEDLELRSIVLVSCKAQRADADPDGRGEVSAALKITKFQDSELLSYEVTGTYEFSTEDDESLAKIEATFAAVYGKANEAPLPDADVDDFARSVVFQVTPFLREILATMTNRMALPPFYLPLLRQADLEIEAE